MPASRTDSPSLNSQGEAPKAVGRPPPARSLLLDPRFDACGGEASTTVACSPICDRSRQRSVPSAVPDRLQPDALRPRAGELVRRGEEACMLQ